MSLILYMEKDQNQIHPRGLKKVLHFEQVYVLS